VWRVAYEDRAREARDWAKRYRLAPAAQDEFRVCLVAVDVQNTFCIPDFELFVGGRSGHGAVDDNRRLVEFVYRNLGTISQVVASLDTHHAFQVFHAVWLVDEDGNHPGPYTRVSVEDVRTGRYRVNPSIADALGLDAAYVERHLSHYAAQLAGSAKYDLTIWPYHAMLGGIGNALVAAVEEAFFFHSIARYSQPDFHVKGTNPLTEHYSVLGPEVTEGPDGERLAMRDRRLVEELLDFDAIVIAGQAKSHCLAWTIDDLLDDPQTPAELAGRTYLLEDCTSPVFIPDVIDYTDAADAAFERYQQVGAHVVKSTDPVESWPGVFDNARRSP
jgi:nicotinamidase-related amidase